MRVGTQLTFICTNIMYVLEMNNLYLGLDLNTNTSFISHKEAVFVIYEYNIPLLIVHIHTDIKKKIIGNLTSLIFVQYLHNYNTFTHLVY